MIPINSYLALTLEYDHDELMNKTLVWHIKQIASTGVGLLAAIINALRRKKLHVFFLF